MQNQKRTVAVHLVAQNVSGDGSRETQGEVTLQFWDQKARFRRAAQTWAACWGGAIIAVLIPLVHFILVPTLLLAGPIAASIIYGQKDVVLGGTGTCPHCGKPFDIVRNKLSWPLSDICASCQKEAKIFPDEPQAASQ